MIFTDVFEDVTKQGRKLQTNEYRESGKYAIIDQGQNTIAGYTDEEEGVFADIPAIVFGDHTRVIKYIDTPCFLGADGVKLLKAKIQNPNYKYLYYSLLYADIPNTGYNRHFKWLKEVNIKLPNDKEQQSIVVILDRVSHLISLRKQQLAKLDELVKGRFVELFGDPKLNNKGWKSGVISDYFEVKGGKRIPKGMGYSDTKTNHPYLRATDMKNETILEDDIHYITEEVFQHIKRYTVKGGDIYLTNVGVNLGMAGVIPQKFDGASLTENAVKLVPKTEEEIDGMFLAHYINSPGIQEYINERKMAVGVPKLAIFRIETMPLLIPPMEVQQDFISFVKQTDKSKSAIQKSLDKLETLRKALMQKYFG